MTPPPTMAPILAREQWQRWTCEMQIVVTDPDALQTARREVDDELDAVEAAASRFRPDSEVCRLAAAAGLPTEVSAKLADLLDAALTAARLTDGDVDPTIGAALVSLGADPDPRSLDARLPTALADFPPIVFTPTSWSMVTLEGRVVTVPPGMLLDLGATAKAVAADECAKRVHATTRAGVLVNLGGDIATAGPAPSGGWQVGVLDATGEPEGSVALPAGAALATSSTIRRRWRRGDDVLHHILDPRTARPANPVWRTVSVAAATCHAANTVSTAAIVRGSTAPQWIRSLGLTARLVDRHRVVHFVGDWPPDRERRR
ncbi:FAD:protein FMN transferase [Mycolicibacterium sp. 050158]|uniref:FAD:protein FMN transferase n=1 Tax=Mycolicibacterium sp. 050158 TaxID=3090602 RepID=UPI00299DCF16|nr:FAD:protein FMN transferase [Mycolicibacterium sp. 050158]MDX1890745.1 FAD:protein FMN transferase [Mycolicibacterium sp. 050158]